MAKLEVEIGIKNFDGYKPAFKGAMQAYGILAIKSARWLQHVTGTGGESVEHYWKNDCETCKEIAEFISEWIDAAEHSVNPTNGIQASPQAVSTPEHLSDLEGLS